MRELASLTAADFAAALGSDFEIVEDGATPVTIRLTEVVELAERPGHRRAFSLRFHGPSSPTLAHATHRLAHAGMGELEIFLGPVASDSGGIAYEAVFA
jgi:hypothetical protein